MSVLRRPGPPTVRGRYGRHGRLGGRRHGRRPAPSPGHRYGRSTVALSWRPIDLRGSERSIKLSCSSANALFEAINAHPVAGRLTTERAASQRLSHAYQHAPPDLRPVGLSSERSYLTATRPFLLHRGHNQNRAAVRHATSSVINHRRITGMLRDEPFIWRKMAPRHYGPLTRGTPGGLANQLRGSPLCPSQER